MDHATRSPHDPDQAPPAGWWRARDGQWYPPERRPNPKLLAPEIVVVRVGSATRRDVRSVTKRASIGLAVVLGLVAIGSSLRGGEEPVSVMTQTLERDQAPGVTSQSTTTTPTSTSLAPTTTLAVEPVPAPAAELPAIAVTVPVPPVLAPTATATPKRVRARASAPTTVPWPSFAPTPPTPPRTSSQASVTTPEAPVSADSTPAPKSAPTTAAPTTAAPTTAAPTNPTPDPPADGPIGP